MKCDKCNGTGELNQGPYRTAANKVKEAIKPVSNVFVRSFAKVGAKTKTIKEGFQMKILMTGLKYAAIIGAVAALIWVIAESVKEEMKMVVVSVQYSDSGEVVRCWLGSSAPNLRDHSAVELADNEKQIQPSLKKLGAKDNMQCMDLRKK